MKRRNDDEVRQTITMLRWCVVLSVMIVLASALMGG